MAGPILNMLTISATPLISKTNTALAASVTGKTSSA
jgi:hypothetical protein